MNNPVTNTYIGAPLVYTNTGVISSDLTMPSWVSQESYTAQMSAPIYYDFSGSSSSEAVTIIPMSSGKDAYETAQGGRDILSGAGQLFRKDPVVRWFLDRTAPLMSVVQGLGLEGVRDGDIEGVLPKSGLFSDQSLERALALVKEMESSNEDERSEARHELADFAFRLRGEALAQVVQEIEKQYVNRNPSIRLAAVNMASDLFAHLHRKYRPDRVLAFEERLKDWDNRVAEAALNAVRASLKHIGKETLPDRIVKIEALLENEDEFRRRMAIDLLRDAVSMLPSEHQIASLEKIEALMTGDSDAGVRWTAMNAVRSLITSVNEEERPRHIDKLASRFADKSEAVRRAAIEAVYDAASHLVPDRRMKYIMAIAQLFGDRVEDVRRSAEEAVRSAIGSLLNDYLELGSMMVEMLGTNEHNVRLSAMNVLKLLSPLVPVWERENFFMVIESYLKDANPEIRRLAGSIIDEMALQLTFDQRMNILSYVVERDGLKNISMEFLHAIVKHVPIEALRVFPDRGIRADLTAIADYYTANIPFDDYFWPQYLGAVNRGLFLQNTASEIDKYRKGGDYSISNTRQMRLVYAGMDGLTGKSFDSFLTYLRRHSQMLPLRFLKKAFEGMVMNASAEGSVNEDAAINVEFVPSKSMADVFLGPDDSNHKLRVRESIESSDFQVYRIIINSRLGGAIYLQRIESEKRKYLLMGIEPLPWANLNQDSLLELIENNIALIAEEAGYDGVFFTADDKQQSHHPGMLEAISKKGHRKIKHGPFATPAFSDREFLVVWRRGIR